MLLLLLACSAVTPCSASPEPPEVGACFDGPAAGDTGGYYSAFDAAWSGTVTEVGSGAFPTDCTHHVGADPADEGWWARVDTADGAAVFGVSTPGTAAPDVGATLTVTAYDLPGMFGPTLAALEVRDDTLRDWVGVAGTPEELRAPAELGFATGSPVCSARDGCGAWRGHDLEVTLDGATTTAERHATTPVGGLEVSVYDLVHQVDAQGTCPDWFVASAIVGVAR